GGGRYEAWAAAAALIVRRRRDVHDDVRRRARTGVVRDDDGVRERAVGESAVEFRRHGDVGQPVVVVDDAASLGLPQARAARVAQREVEGLVALHVRVGTQLHVDGLRRLAGGEDQRTRRGIVVFAGARGAVGR